MRGDTPRSAGILSLESGQIFTTVRPKAYKNMGKACCEHHDESGGDSALSGVLATVMELAADLAAKPAQWPRWAWVCIGLWFLTSCYFLLFAMAMYLQELKSYGGASKVSLPKMLAFSLTWMNGSLLASALCIPDLLLGRRELAAEKVHYYGSIMGQFMFRILSRPPLVIGLENLPPDGDKGMVYVSNHQTSVDIALFYYIGAERKFSWVSKSTVFLIPGVGLLMKIARYVALKRGNRDSVKKMFDDCKKRLASGWSVMIFPQGTRRRMKVLDFKDGAFQLAIDSNSVVVSWSWSWRRKRASFFLGDSLGEGVLRCTASSGRVLIHGRTLCDGQELHGMHMSPGLKSNLTRFPRKTILCCFARHTALSVSLKFNPVLCSI